MNKNKTLICTDPPINTSGFYWNVLRWMQVDIIGYLAVFGVTITGWDIKELEEPEPPKIMKTNRQIIKVIVDPDGDEIEIECVPADFALRMENDLYEAAKIMHRLLRYADKTAENHPKAVTSAGQNARVFAGIWLSKFERENAEYAKTMTPKP